jgi:hypothetical protein
MRVRVVGIDAVGHDQADLALFALAVALETIRSERAGERGEPRVVRRVGETIKAGRQQSGEASGQKQVARASRIFEPEQHCGERTAAAGQGQISSGLGLET